MRLQALCAEQDKAGALIKPHPDQVVPEPAFSVRHFDPRLVEEACVREVDLLLDAGLLRTLSAQDVDQDLNEALVLVAQHVQPVRAANQELGVSEESHVLEAIDLLVGPQNWDVVVLLEQVHDKVLATSQRARQKVRDHLLLEAAQAHDLDLLESGLAIEHAFKDEPTALCQGVTEALQDVLGVRHARHEVVVDQLVDLLLQVGAAELHDHEVLDDLQQIL